MKKLIALLMAAMLVLSMAACSGEDEKQPQDDQQENQEQEIEDQDDAQEPQLPEDETPDEPEGDQTSDDKEDGNSPEGETPSEPDDTQEPQAPSQNGGQGQSSQSGGSNQSGSESNTPSNDGGESESPSEPETPSEPAEGDASSTDLSSTMATILNGVADLPAVWDIPLDSTNFEFYAFIPYVDGYQGLASDAMIGSIAHSCVLVQVPEGTDVQSVADSIKANANPAKWICVTAEKTEVAVNGNLILLVMTSSAAADAIIANFQAL